MKKILPTGKKNYVLFPLKKPDGTLREGVIEITEEEFTGIRLGTHCFNETLTAVVPAETEAPLQKQPSQILELRKTLKKISEDLIQSAAGAIIPDIEERKAQFREAHNKLRELTGLPPREYEGD